MLLVGWLYSHLYLRLCLRVYSRLYLRLYSHVYLHVYLHLYLCVYSHVFVLEILILHFGSTSILWKAYSQSFSLHVWYSCESTCTCYSHFDVLALVNLCRDPHKRVCVGVFSFLCVQFLVVKCLFCVLPKKYKNAPK